jgi:hypothetical protein
VLPEALEKHCIEAESFLDKNAGPGKKAAFAHLPLWICRRFSTGAPVYRRFSCLSQHKPGSEPDFWQCRPGMHRMCFQRTASAFSLFLQTKTAEQ